MAKRMRRSGPAHNAPLLFERAPRRSRTSSSTDDDDTDSTTTTSSRTRTPRPATTTAADDGDDSTDAATASDTVPSTTAAASVAPVVATSATARRTSSTPTLASSTSVASLSSLSTPSIASLSSASPSPTTASDSSSTSTLSTGAIGGIAFGAVVGAFAVCYTVWRVRKARGSGSRHRGGAGFGGYQRHDDDRYAWSNDGGGGGALRKGDKDHQSFGNIAGMGDDLGLGPMSEKGASQWDDVGLHDHSYHPSAQAGLDNVAGVGSARRGPNDHASAYYNSPAGHLSSYYNAPSHGQLPAPPMPDPSRGYDAAAQDDARASIGAMLAGGAVAAAATGPMGKPLSVVREEDEDERTSRYSGGLAAAAAAGGIGADDSTPFADPPEAGKTFIVRRTFEPSMNDELIILPGDRIQILTSYDDGWCLGVNLDAPPSDPSRPNRGVFPRDCVEELVGSSNLQRVPTLPPLDLGHDVDENGDQSGDRVVLGFDHSSPSPGLPTTPAIEVSPAVDDHFLSTDHGMDRRSLSTPSPKLDKLQRRASSLIASRDAELFMALGAALDARDAQKK